nr:hypothetical protein [Cellulomonas sp. HZM]
MSHHPIRVAGTVLAAAAVALVPSAAAATTVVVQAGGPVVAGGGSDAALPYLVDQTGVTLLGGAVFEAHGHVNITLVDGSQRHIHLDPDNGQPGGVWIGRSHIPWSAFGLEPPFAVTWVQVAGYDEHFGEGGQPPVVVAPPTEPTGPY